MVRAAMVNMRPSWPPPRMPRVAPGKIGSVALKDSDPPWAEARVASYAPGRMGGLFDIGQFHRQHRVGLAAAEVIELLGQAVVVAGDQRGSEQRRVGGAGFADGEGGDRDALGPLHAREQRIHAPEV